MGKPFNYQGKETTIIEEGESFQFHCRKCGNCCRGRDNDIILSSHDVYSLAKGLNLTTVEIIEKYTQVHIGNNSCLPIPTLKNVKSFMGDTHCVFLENGKCKVQDYKPSVCRLYPLGRAISSDKKTGEKEFFYFLQHDTCGDESEKESLHTLDEWFPNRKESEAAFDIASTYHFKLIQEMELPQMYTADFTTEKSKNMFTNMLLDAMYLRYDTNEDFLPQYKRNMDAAINTFEKIVPFFKLINKSE